MLGLRLFAGGDDHFFPLFIGGAVDFPPLFQKFFGDDGGIVGKGRIEGEGEAGAVFRHRNADAGPRAHGLDDDGVFEPLFYAADGEGGTAGVVCFADAQPRQHGHAQRAGDELCRRLIHEHGRGHDPGRSAGDAVEV